MWQYFQKEVVGLNAVPVQSLYYSCFMTSQQATNQTNILISKFNLSDKSKRKDRKPL